MKIDAIGWAPQIVDHIAQIWMALPEKYRGTFFVRSTQKHRVRKYPFEMVPFRTFLDISGDYDDPVLVANPSSLRIVNRANRKSILMTHDAGDTLSNGVEIEPSYLRGGSICNNTILYLAPGYHIANAFSKVFPNIPVQIIGCPKLDPWLNGKRKVTMKNDPPIVVISFTWDWMKNQAIRGAWEYYSRYLSGLAKSDKFTLIGNAHPKFITTVAHHYRRMGIRIESDFEWILENADLYVCDRSSTIYEFAAIGKPIVFLDAPWNANADKESLRFGKGSQLGLHCSNPESLHDTILLALEDHEDVRKKREETLDYVFPVRDGTSAIKAANAILSALGIDKIVDSSVLDVDSDKEEQIMSTVWMKAEKPFKSGAPLQTENGFERMIRKGVKFAAPEHLARHYKRRKIADYTNGPSKDNRLPGPSEKQINAGPSEVKTEIKDEVVETEDNSEENETEVTVDTEVNNEDNANNKDEENEDEDDEPVVVIGDDEEDDNKGKQEFYCQDCNREFGSLRALEAHNRQKHGE